MIALCTTCLKICKPPARQPSSFWKRLQNLIKWMSSKCLEKWKKTSQVECLPISSCLNVCLGTIIFLISSLIKKYPRSLKCIMGATLLFCSLFNTLISLNLFYNMGIPIQFIKREVFSCVSLSRCWFAWKMKQISLKQLPTQMKISILSLEQTISCKGWTKGTCDLNVFTKPKAKAMTPIQTHCTLISFWQPTSLKYPNKPKMKRTERTTNN